MHLAGGESGGHWATKDAFYSAGEISNREKISTAEYTDYFNAVSKAATRALPSATSAQVILRLTDPEDASDFL